MLDHDLESLAAEPNAAYCRMNGGGAGLFPGESFLTVVHALVTSKVPPPLYVPDRQFYAMKLMSTS